MRPQPSLLWPSPGPPGLMQEESVLPSRSNLNLPLPSSCKTPPPGAGPPWGAPPTAGAPRRNRSERAAVAPLGPAPAPLARPPVLPPTPAQPRPSLGGPLSRALSPQRASPGCRGEETAQDFFCSRNLGSRVNAPCGAPGKLHKSSRRLQPGETVPGEWMRTARIKKGPQLCPQPRSEVCAPSQLSQAALRPRGRWRGWERSATPGAWVWPSPSTPSTPGVTLLARSVRRPDFGFSENAVKH
ncbi:basic proline-rich protein-like [Acinonyx jubatus]|uniref:Basic proline-rich protein-like n=1 Tax=Acinonyx jubatus TaxID=32536 RepID=A0ABM3ND00_ACIJB|nr:basic proline-rich protein-like [Acinonyx jubatus]